MEETLTDKEFCKTFKINRATSLRWREEGIVSYVKTPNGSIRYLPHHVEEFIKSYEKKTRNGAGQVQDRRLQSI